MTSIAKLIDHTLLRPDATRADVLQLCDEAVRYGFFAVCVHPYFSAIAKEALFKSHVKVAAVIGFPLGMTLSAVKIYEAMQTVLNGADELDVVINTGLAKSGEWDAVKKEISDIVTATPEAVHKIIIETCYLTDDEKKKACKAVIEAGADYIKTSTGFGPSGAVIRDVQLIKTLTKGKPGIKAAGGIKTFAQAKALIEAGATRIGTSSGAAIMKEAPGEY
ncbi:MAG: deoxyribose-phosphate aldolase [Nitrospiraceae bacterium]|nr:MAG: deoxyribose-phosphate aldolase [Nitrospiraceae bacterium]